MHTVFSSVTKFFVNVVCEKAYISEKQNQRTTLHASNCSKAWKRTCISEASVAVAASNAAVATLAVGVTGGNSEVAEAQASGRALLDASNRIIQPASAVAAAATNI